MPKRSSEANMACSYHMANQLAIGCSLRNAAPMRSKPWIWMSRTIDVAYSGVIRDNTYPLTAAMNPARSSLVGSMFAGTSKFVWM